MNSLPDRPESKPPELPDNIEYAGFWIRFGATMLDTLILLLITLPLTFVFYGAEFWEKEGTILLGGWDFAINWVFPAMAVILFWFFKGATPGKMFTSTKVVDEKTGLKPGGWQSVIRYFAYIVSILPLCMGFFWIVVDKKKQGWHDKIAKTVVVKTRNVVQPEAIE